MNSNPVVPRTLTQTALLVAGAASGIFFIAGFLVLGAVAPNYSLMHNTISALEFTDLGTAQRLNFIIFGALLACFALGIRKELRNDRGAYLVPFFQLLSAGAVIGDGLFIHEPLHTTCDLIAFNATIATLFLFAWRFWNDPRWKGWSTYSILTAVTMMAFLAAFGVSNSHGGAAGAFEKLAVLTRAIWSLLFVGRLLRGAHLYPDVTRTVRPVLE